MVINLIKKDQMFSMTLPQKVKGQYWIHDLDELGKSRELISVEAINGEWAVNSNHRVSVLNSSNEFIENTILKPLTYLNLKINLNQENVILYSEPISQTRQLYNKIMVIAPCELTIGRSKENQICFDNKFVSSKHTKIIYDGKSWSVIDINSTNGTYVNGFRVESQPIFPGDFIYIMGLKIIIGNKCFAINNPDNTVSVNVSQTIPFVKQRVEEREAKTDDGLLEFFYRSPRFKRDITVPDIVIDPPPAVQKVEHIPIALILGPSITMGLTSLSTALLTLNNVMNNGGQISQALPTLFMSFSMLLGTILWPILTKRHENKQRIANERKRQEKYLAYLDSVRDEIKRKCREQSEILIENIISIEECYERIMSRKRNLWERVTGQDDFLRLKLGTGNLPLYANIKFPEKHFSMDDDNLQDALFSLGNEPKQLLNVPVSISIIDKFVIGLIGNRQDTLSLIKSILLQIIALHSYDEVKLVFIMDKDEKKEWDFVKWFPHVWNDERNTRFIASNLEEVKELSMIMEKNLLTRKDDSNKKDIEYIPYYVLVSSSKELADKCEAFNQLLKYKNNSGFSIITLYDEIQNLPKETHSVIEVNAGSSKIYEKDDISGKYTAFSADYVEKAIIESVAIAIANIQMDLSSQRFILPNMVTFLEMFHVGKIEHLNSLTRWKENNPTVTLQTPIGVDIHGEEFMLDLHEKFHGPHGLVAGMTGSGKSEFIITYILSLAINFHPDEVAFILIDYKGGGLTGAFENSQKGIKLPHLAGTITNLDGAAVKRSLISIQSELRRRQAIFNEARKIANEGTMDIYKYQQLYREKIVNEPVPHLFIISDEFAELKTQQPEFMEQLVSAARIGRSLGIHLILATQKPNGVVDDQIWSNSKFRVCLKVQEKADSMDMIKCPDAAELSQTGRFYLQVGFNELFALGQSAWCGAEYIPTENVVKQVDSGIQLVDNIGRVIKDIKLSKKAEVKTSKAKQIVSVVNYLYELALEEHIAVRQLWLDSIPALIFVEDLESKYNFYAENTVLNPIIGEYDDPFNQKQNLLTLPLSEEGNCVVYGATGNGKLTFITIMIYSLIRHYSAQFVNIYIMDFGAETLRAFEKAPQVGDVLYSFQNERIINLFKMLGKELDERKQLFSAFGGDYSTYIRNSGRIIPNIVVVLNNYAGFAEQYEDLEENFSMLTRDGIKYGIHFVVTASSTNAVRYRTLQNFKLLLTMQLNDPSDYTVIVGKTDGLIPSKYKGRGLINKDRAYEFQTAYCKDCKDQFEFLKNYCIELSMDAKVFARKVPVLPNVLNFEEIKQEISNIQNVPIGIAKKTLSIVKLNITLKYIFPIIAQDTNQLEAYTQSLAKVYAASNVEVRIIDGEQLFSGEFTEDYTNYTYIKDDFENTMRDLFADIVERNNTYMDSDKNLKSLDLYPRKVVFFIGLKRIFERLTDDGKDKFRVFMENGKAIYKVHFILAEISSQLNQFTYDKWYKDQISGNDGIWIGDGFTDQYLVKASKLTSELYEEIGDEFGYFVYRNKPTLIKLLTTKSSDMEED